MSKTKVEIDVDKIMAAAIQAAGDLCMEIAEQIATEAKKSKKFTDESGKLRESIRARRINGKKTIGAVVEAGDTAGSEAFYAPFIEYGHITKSGKWVPARAFMRPARWAVTRKANMDAIFARYFKERS